MVNTIDFKMISSEVYDRFRRENATLGRELFLWVWGFRNRGGREVAVGQTVCWDKQMIRNVMPAKDRLPSGGWGQNISYYLRIYLNWVSVTDI